jgi:hypothetical protein
MIRHSFNRLCAAADGADGMFLPAGNPQVGTFGGPGYFPYAYGGSAAVNYFVHAEAVSHDDPSVPFHGSPWTTPAITVTAPIQLFQHRKSTFLVSELKSN